MGLFGSQDLAAKFGIVLGGLFLITFVAALIKICVNKRRLKRNIKLEAAAIANKEDQEKLNQRELDEGDLFGVRAIERGYFGGVAQSRSTSPAASMFRPTPSTTVENLGEAYKMTNPSSAASSTTHLQSHSRNSSESKINKPKPSPLRFQPSETQIQKSVIHPTQPSTPKDALLGNHFEHNSMSESPQLRPISDAFQLRYQGEIQQNFLSVAKAANTVRSEHGSIYGSADPSPAPTPPATAHLSSQFFHSRPTSRERSRSRPNVSVPAHIPVPALPSPYQDDSRITIQGHEHRVYNYQTASNSDNNRGRSSNRKSYHPSQQSQPRAPSQPQTRIPSLIRAQDSIRHPHIHKKTPSSSSTSSNSSTSSRNNDPHSRERDQMHYNPAMRSPVTGRVMGRAVDFDRPRESPFVEAAGGLDGRGSVGSGSNYSGSSVEEMDIGGLSLDLPAGMGRGSFMGRDAGRRRVHGAGEMV